VSATGQQATALELCRVALLVGDDMEIDYVLPAGVALIAVTEDLIPRINEILRRRGRAELDAKRTYRLCRADARPLDPQRSLTECGVLDGEQLWLLPLEATERFEPVVETVSTAVARALGDETRYATINKDVARRVAGWLAAALVGWSELILAWLWWHGGGWVPAAVSWGLTAVLAFAAWLASTALDEQRRRSTDAFAWSALIPAGAGAAMSVPGHPGGWHLVAGIGAVLTGVAILALLTARHVAAVAATTTVAVFAGTVAVLHACRLELRAEQMAVAALVIVLVLVTFATNVGVSGSGIPGPWFPSLTSRGVFETAPGAPRDTVTPMAPSGAESPEQIAAWSQRGNAIVTGVMLGAAVVTVVASRYAVVPGQPGGWRFLVFTLGICLILVLRAQSFVDRTQALSLVVGATAAVATVIGRYATAAMPPQMSMTLGCVAATLGLGVLGLLAALVVPAARINAPIRRAVEMSQWVLLAPVVPWTLWLLGAFTAMRNLVHG
jgi:type VII secretion integral membrane protein EccD